MAKPDFKSESRKEWAPTHGTPSWEQLALGCQQRIADAAERTATATERMASNYLQLQKDAAHYQKWWLEGREKVEKLQRTIANLKGQVTKAKKMGGQDA